MFQRVGAQYAGGGGHAGFGPEVEVIVVAPAREGATDRSPLPGDMPNFVGFSTITTELRFLADAPRLPTSWPLFHPPVITAGR